MYVCIKALVVQLSVLAKWLARKTPWWHLYVMMRLPPQSTGEQIVFSFILYVFYVLYVFPLFVYFPWTYTLDISYYYGTIQPSFGAETAVNHQQINPNLQPISHFRFPATLLLK